MLWAPGPGRSRHFVHRGKMELLLAFRSCDGRKGEEPNHARQVSLVDERLRLLRDTVGPALGAFGAFRVRGFEM
jgi:hypothetical protein